MHDAGCDELHIGGTHRELTQALTWLKKAPVTDVTKARHRFSDDHIRMLRSTGEQYNELTRIDKAEKELRKYIRRKPDCLKKKKKSGKRTSH
jgi:hypothetical protein